MQKTVQDIKKISSQGQKLFKGFFYYAYIPAIVILGLKTVDWQNFSNPQPPMWSNKASNKARDLFVLFYLKNIVNLLLNY